jgi:hypothetical protein
MESNQSAGKASSPDSRKRSKPIPGEQEPNGELAISARGEHICDDAGTEPARADIQRLCRIWAEVGRAILLRRKQTGEEVVNQLLQRA